jgi:hypothetical protein
MHHTVAGIHAAADSVRMVGIHIVDSYQAAYSAGNNPVLGVALAGKRLTESLADWQKYQPGVAAALVLDHLHMDFASG